MSAMFAHHRNLFAELISNTSSAIESAMQVMAMTMKGLLILFLSSHPPPGHYQPLIKPGSQTQRNFGMESCACRVRENPLSSRMDLQDALLACNRLERAAPFARGSRLNYPATFQRFFAPPHMHCLTSKASTVRRLFQTRHARILST